MDYSYKKELYDFACSEASKNKAVMNEQQNRLDSSIIKFSAGSYALTFTLINHYFPLCVSACKWFMISAWILFSVSIIAGLLSYKFSVKKHELDYNYEFERYEALSNDKAEPAYKNIFYSLCGMSNMISFCSFVCGIICVIVFVCLNI